MSKLRQLIKRLAFRFALLIKNGSGLRSNVKLIINVILVLS